jgi:hypothetical protein
MRDKITKEGLATKEVGGINFSFSLREFCNTVTIAETVKADGLTIFNKQYDVAA